MEPQKIGNHWITKMGLITSPALILLGMYAYRYGDRIIGSVIFSFGLFRFGLTVSTLLKVTPRPIELKFSFVNKYIGLFAAILFIIIGAIFLNTANNKIGLFIFSVGLFRLGMSIGVLIKNEKR
jgi:succinate-acetate transporter protein